jgi:DNA primase
MEVSEDTLFGALAQLKQKNNRKGAKRLVPNENVSLVKKTANDSLKVDHSYELEKQIISILLHYGGHEAEFNETIIRSDESGELIEDTRTISAKVYEKVFLDLQQDEIELTNATFKNLFYKLIESYQVEEGQLNLEKIMQTDDMILNEMVTDLVMKDEQYYLHGWEKKNIFVKNRDTQVGQLVNETILSLRRYLIDQKIKELQSQTQGVSENKEVLEDVLSYYQLKKVLSKKLNRVL